MLLADLRTLTERVLRAGIEASSPRLAVRRHLGVHEGMLRFGPRGRRLSEVRRVVVLGAGKAAGSMAGAVHEVLGDRIADGVLVVPIVGRPGAAVPNSTSAVASGARTAPVPGPAARPLAE